MSCNGSSISDLPWHIIVDILSRLPVKNIIYCRCVCKTWLNLLSAPYFANLHLSRSPTTTTSLIIYQFGLPQSNVLDLVELEDEPDHHDLHWDPVMRFDLRVSFQYLVGSTNGLLCLSEINDEETIYICSPIVRQYVTLPKSKFQRVFPAVVVNAFGFSSVTSQYKVVRICQVPPIGDPMAWSSSYKSDGEVYTLGTGTWRSIGHVPFLHDCRLDAVSLNDNLHWLAYEQDSPALICCFEIDNESFQSMAGPPDQINPGTRLKSLGVLGGCLCVCDNSSDFDLVVWVMKDYGVKESWGKEIVINKIQDLLSYEVAHPLKVLKDGDILMLWFDQFLFSYSPGRRTWEEINVPVPNTQEMQVMVHVASFISLRDFGMEKVDVF